MRVVIVHNRYRSENPSGENRVVESDIEQLRADGVEVIPYIRDSDEIDAFTPFGKAGLAVRPIVSPVDTLAFRRLLREVQPHIVHLHNPFPLISPWIVRTAKAQRVPVVQTVHNYRHVCVNGIHFRDGHLCTECVGKKVPWPAVQHGCYQGSRARSVPMAAALMAHRGTWNQVDRFLPVGEAVAQHLAEIGIHECRIVVRPNALEDPGEPAPLGNGALFVGRLSTEKGIDLLLHAWQRSGLEHHGQTLRIAGDGELRESVKAAANSSPSIEYVGLLDRLGLANEYRMAALVVAPSLCKEADGLSIAAALAHGRPAIATNLGSPPLMLTGECGWVCTADSQALIETLRCALEDRRELVRRGANARIRFLATRSLDHLMPLRGVYESILDSLTPPTHSPTNPCGEGWQRRRHALSAPAELPGYAVPNSWKLNENGVLSERQSFPPCAEVTLLWKSLSHYRISFCELVRLRLAEKGIRLRLIVGDATGVHSMRRDEGSIEWAEPVRNRSMQIMGRTVIWQPCLRSLQSSDLVIVEQASKLLINYPLLAWRRLGGPKVAWWGHGINLDQDIASSVGEAVKRRLAAQADWWFCYTEDTAKIVTGLGVSRERMTVVQNAIDTTQLRAERESLSAADITTVRRTLGFGDGPIALWLSSIYERKRPRFMLEAADHIRAQLPTFELIVIGDGPERRIFDNAADTRDWVHVLGAMNGLSAVAPAAAASIIVNPGLVGLSVLDGFALGLPMITCDIGGHGPEIEYLQHGTNGIVASSDATPADYAATCVEVLTNRAELDRLSAGARQASGDYTIEDMVDRFCEGVVEALSLSKRLAGQSHQTAKLVP